MKLSINQELKNLRNPNNIAQLATMGNIVICMRHVAIETC